MLTLYRIVAFALSAFWRNIWLSVATTLVMFLTLFMVTSLVLLNLLAGSALEIVQSKVDMSVYFVPEATTEEANVVRSRLQARSEVDTITYISRDDALEDFSERHANDPLILTAIEELGENPLQPSLVVKAKSPGDYPAIVDFLQEDTFDGVVESVSLDDNREIVEKLASTTALLRRLAVWVTAMFSVIAILIMFNTIRLAIYTQKDEISVMRLVGATSALIRMPLVLVAVMYGLLATALSTIVLYPAAKYVGPQANAFLGEQSLDVFALFSENLVLIIALQLGFSIALGAVSSFIAIRRYLKG